MAAQQTVSGEFRLYLHRLHSKQDMASSDSTYTGSTASRIWRVQTLPIQAPQQAGYGEFRLYLYKLHSKQDMASSDSTQAPQQAGYGEFRLYTGSTANRIWRVQTLHRLHSKQDLVSSDSTYTGCTANKRVKQVIVVGAYVI